MNVASSRAHRWRPLVWPAVAALVALGILIGLGTWQLERKSWKDGLVAAIAARAYGEPGTSVPEAAWPRWNAAEDEFRRVRLGGRFLHDREVQLHGLAEERPGLPLQGFYVFTPLRSDDGAIVMVNRGFVPTERRPPAGRREGQPEGAVTVTGLVRNPETRGLFVPPNDPAKDDWFVRDLREISAARGLTRVAPFYVDADGTTNPGGWPRGGLTRIKLPNNHLQYAATWFGIAATLVGVFVAFAAGRLRSGRELEAEDPDHDQGDAGEPGHVRRIAE